MSEEIAALSKTINRDANYITINCNKTKLNSYLMVTRCSCGSTNGKKCCILVNQKVSLTCSRLFGYEIFVSDSRLV